MSESCLSLKILLVEDDPIVAKVHIAMLNQMDCAVDWASNGKEAIELSSNNYNLIILDWGLPDINGITVSKIIRKIEKINNIPKKNIIMLTAYSCDYLLEEQLGIDKFANKPISYKALKEIVFNTLKNKEGDNGD